MEETQEDRRKRLRSLASDSSAPQLQAADASTEQQTDVCLPNPLASPSFALPKPHPPPPPPPSSPYLINMNYTTQPGQRQQQDQSRERMISGPSSQAQGRHPKHRNNVNNQYRNSTTNVRWDFTTSNIGSRGRGRGGRSNFRHHGQSNETTNTGDKGIAQYFSTEMLGNPWSSLELYMQEHAGGRCDEEGILDRPWH